MFVCELGFMNVTSKKKPSTENGFKVRHKRLLTDFSQGVLRGKHVNFTK